MHAITTNQLTTSRAIRLFRICRILLLTLVGLFIAALLLPFAKNTTRGKLVRWWCKNLLAAFNIRVIRSGYVPSKDSQLANTIFVANHISWSDIHALNSVTPLRFIAKAEIQHWPIFGYLAKKSNALFIDRAKRHEAARSVDTLATCLKAGHNLCLFPEGTTTDGNVVKPFKSSLIQAAIEAESTIWPVAIYYPHPQGGSNSAMAYAGEISLGESMQQVLMQRAPVVELRFLAPIQVNQLNEAEKDRRVLTAHLHQLISKALYG